MDVLSALSRPFRDSSALLIGTLIFAPCLLAAFVLNLIPLLGLILSIPFLGVTVGYSIRCAFDSTPNGAPNWHDFRKLWTNGLCWLLAGWVWAFVLSLPLGFVLGLTGVALELTGAGVPAERFFTAGGLEEANLLFLLLIMLVFFVYFVVVVNVSVVATLAAGERGIEGGFDIRRVVKIAVSGRWFWPYLVAGVLAFVFAAFGAVILSGAGALLEANGVPLLVAFLPFVLALPLLFVIAVFTYTLFGQGYKAAAGVVDGNARLTGKSAEKKTSNLHKKPVSNSSKNARRKR